MEGARTPALRIFADMGEQLGGRPKGEEFYDAKGHVLYDRVAASEFFRDGVSRLERGIENHNVALLCSEENPAVCHRKLLIGRVLAERGFAVQHIRGDGRMQSDEDLADTEGSLSRTGNLFPDAEVSPWKSIPSVLRKKRQSNSLKFQPDEKTPVHRHREAFAHERGAIRKRSLPLETLRNSKPIPLVKHAALLPNSGEGTYRP